VSRAACLALALALLALPVAAVAHPAPRASLTDIEDEVMCPTCGTLLQLAESPQAQDERDFIRHEINQGKTKQQIKDDLVRQFGTQVLALPPASGFDLAAYLVPAAGLIAAAIGIFFGLRRWRRAGPPAGGESQVDAADEKRLDTDLAKYDL
jgi:cytochrome c-type biogenesis protein CcmH